MTRTFYRSRTDRMLLGVCGGLAAYFGVDPTAIRVLAVLLAWLSFGAAVIAYFVIALVVPEEPLGVTSGETARTAPYERPQHAAVTGKDVAMNEDKTGEPVPTGEEQPGQPAPEAPAQPSPEGAPAPPPAPSAPPPYPPMPPTPAAPQQPAPQPPQAPPGWAQQPQPRRRGGLVGGIVLIVLGVLFLAQQFIPGFNIGQLWPVILIVIGLAIIFRRR